MDFSLAPKNNHSVILTLPFFTARRSCVICSGVLENPVQTPCEHMFCEEELLEWMTRKGTCPLDRAALDPDHIQPPSRIVLGMLGDLRRKCDHEAEGCEWVGTVEAFSAHVAQCTHLSKAALQAKLQEAEQRNDELRREARDKDALLLELANKLETRTRQLSEALSSLSGLRAATVGPDSPSHRRLKTGTSLLSPKRRLGSPSAASVGSAGRSVRSSAMSPSARRPVSELQALALSLPALHRSPSSSSPAARRR